MLHSLKRIVIGKPLPSNEEQHQRLTKRVGLAVFASDAISSTAYATEEILFVLFPVAGFVSLKYLVPLAWIVVLLLAIVATSYRQTIKAYPSGGGSYVVARENLGVWPSLVAGSSLLVDYVLTVAVSVSAGVAAITSAVDGLASSRVLLCIVAIAIIAIANLRGVKESGRVFAIPTYAYIISLVVLLAVGLSKTFFGDLGRIPVDPERLQEISKDAAFAQGASLFLLMRAFSSGAVALTGVEAISNGVSAFKKPESKNASTTLVWMAAILGSMFFGVSVLAHRLHPIPSEHETVLSQVARQVYGGSGVMYWIMQVTTFAILILAANTAFADFPRLSSILAKDRYLPRQFANRGDRLVFSNGVLILAVFAGLLIIAFGGKTNALIPLYAVGVFVAFTLSQAGMVVHHRRLREPAWQRGAVINAVGCVATFVVAIIIMATKFTKGAWVPMVVIPMVMVLLHSTHRHYQRVANLLRIQSDFNPIQRKNTVVVLVSGVHRSSMQAMAFAKSMHPDRLVCATACDEDQAAFLMSEWERFEVSRKLDVELTVIDSPYREVTRPLLAFLDELRAQHPNDNTTVILPELVVDRWWEQLLHNQSALALKARLLFRPRTIVVSVPLHLNPSYHEVEAGSFVLDCQDLPETITDIAVAVERGG
ncbi:MAG: APC family permease [Acidimicrobiales bacterium]